MPDAHNLVGHGTTSPTPSDGLNIQAGTLDEAAAYLRRSIRADGTYEGIPEGEIAGHQWRLLESWTASRGLILPPDFGPEREGGREHDVRFDEPSASWLKYTKPNCAGYTINVFDNTVMMLPATPLQYLDRWKAHNSVFSDSVELAGVWKTSQYSASLVVRQYGVSGVAPDWDAIEATFVNGLGLYRLDVPDHLGGYTSRAYFRGRIGVFDVRPMNCVQTEGGVVVPIDVIPQFFNRSEASILHARTIKANP
jgi:hypothetical protein